MLAASFTTGTVTAGPIGVEPARIVNVSVPWLIVPLVGAADRGVRLTVFDDGAVGIVGRFGGEVVVPG